MNLVHVQYKNNEYLLVKLGEDDKFIYGLNSADLSDSHINLIKTRKNMLDDLDWAELNAWIKQHINHVGFKSLNKNDTRVIYTREL